jgi:hypothetical protein
MIMSHTQRNNKTIPTEGSIEPLTTPDNCTHQYDRYHTRFGDWCCTNCHAQMGWHPQLVREEVFGEQTNMWIAAQGHPTGECSEWDNNVTRIWKNK